MQPSWWPNEGVRRRRRRVASQTPRKARWPDGALSWSGQGEIRTHDTGFTGMPVFETGAFNHSATCPGQPKKLGRRPSRVNELPARTEELREQGTALRGANSGQHFRLVIEARVAQKVGDGAGHSCLVVPRAKHDAVDAGEH